MVADPRAPQAARPPAALILDTQESCRRDVGPSLVRTRAGIAPVRPIAAVATVALAALACPVALGAANSIRVTIAARAIYPGELVVLTVTTPKNVDSVHVRAFTRDQPAFSVGQRTW